MKGVNDRAAGKVAAQSKLCPYFHGVLIGSSFRLSTVTDSSVLKFTVEAILDIATDGGNKGLLSSAAILLNSTFYGNAELDPDFANGVLSLAVASGQATPFAIANTYYEQASPLYMPCACHSAPLFWQGCP